MGRKTKDWTQECNDLALKNGGVFLSDFCKNRDCVVKWRCAQGHVYDRGLPSVKRNFCPYCSGSQLSLDNLQIFAKSKNGECLEYIKGKNPKWRCEFGHVWYAKKNKHWCPYCAGNKKKTFEECNDLANSKGGVCLDNSGKKIVWKCSKGHTWKATYDRVVKSWCKICAYREKAIKPERLYNLAESLGGKFLGGYVKNCFSKVKFKCKNNHIWETVPSTVLYQKSWCPHCQINFGEEICRQIFNYVFGKEFIRIRPGWLISPKGWKLELDGYCDNVAFEYNGPRHYKQYFSEDLSYINICDKIKIDRCHERNIKLFVIKARKKNYNDVIINIKEHLINFGLDADLSNFNIDWNIING